MIAVSRAAFHGDAQTHFGKAVVRIHATVPCFFESLPAGIGQVFSRQEQNSQSFVFQVLFGLKLRGEAEDVSGIAEEHRASGVLQDSQLLFRSGIRTRRHRRGPELPHSPG